ncbi:helix-turn-helix domain-containing protein [Rhodococcus zopfii]|uniref:helix-turn-helix domain-containing protein n=1 Tax=Rhodococcus zopfii TaxID=43772 RepID=UPI0035A235CB
MPCSGPGIRHRGLSRAPVAELASRSGYESEAGFARAFKRVTGESPGSVRRSG